MSRILIFSIFLVILSKINCESDKIVGGDLIGISHAPYQAALLYGGGFFCGASIISTKYLLTAAHCVQEYRDKLSIRVGSNYANRDGEIHQVERIIIHPLFNVNTINYDFAILKIVGEIKLLPNVKEIIKLPAQNDKIESSDEAYITGYGMNKMNMNNDQKLRGVVVPIVSQNECKKSYSVLITNQMICAGFKEGGKDSCSGDSGGPMVRVRDNVQIGVVSFGQGCALPKYYGVYAKVSAVRQWIKSYTNI